MNADQTDQTEFIHSLEKVMKHVKDQISIMFKKIDIVVSSVSIGMILSPNHFDVTFIAFKKVNSSLRDLSIKPDVPHIFINAFRLMYFVKIFK